MCISFCLLGVLPVLRVFLDWLLEAPLGDHVICQQVQVIHGRAAGKAFVQGRLVSDVVDEDNGSVEIKVLVFADLRKVKTMRFTHVFDGFFGCGEHILIKEAHGRLSIFFLPISPGSSAHR